MIGRSPADKIQLHDQYFQAVRSAFILGKNTGIHMGMNVCIFKLWDMVLRVSFLYPFKYMRGFKGFYLGVGVPSLD